MPKIKPKQEFWWEHGGDDEENEELHDHTIIIQPGSMYLRIGRVSDEQPVTVFHCIARKLLKRPLNKAVDEHDNDDYDAFIHRDSLFRSVNKEVEESDTFKQGLQQIKSLLPVPSTKLYMTVNADGSDNAESEEVADTNLDLPTTDKLSSAPSADDQETDLNGSSKIQSYSTLPDVLYDIDALQSDAALYHLFFPYAFGNFNLHDGVGGSLSSSLSNMLAIWEWALSDKLRIPRVQRAKMNVLLSIPNFYTLGDIYVLSELLVNDLGFQAFQLYTEIGCVACATPVFTACIVDIGATHTTIACCDDGYVMPETMVTTKLGGNDVTSLCIWLLTTKIKTFRYSLTIPRNILPNDIVKQQMCVLDWGLKQSLKLNVAFPVLSTSGAQAHQNVQRVRISVPNNLCLTPGCVLFFPSMLTEALDDANCPHPATRIRRDELPLAEHSSEVLPDEDIDQYYNMLGQNVRRMLGFPTPAAVAAAAAAAVASSSSVDVEMTEDAEPAEGSSDVVKQKPGPKPKGSMTASSLANLDEVMSAVIAAAATENADAITDSAASSAADLSATNKGDDDGASDTMQIELAEDDDVNEPEDDTTRSSGMGDAGHTSRADSQPTGLTTSDSTSALKSSASQPESSVGTPVPAATSTTTSLDYKCKTPDADSLTPIDELILWSINQVETKEVKGRCLKNIIIVGGGGYYLKGIEDVLRLRLEQALPKHMSVTVMVNPPDAPGEVTAWQGAAVMATTPVCQNLWVSADMWNQRKLGVFREKALFPMII